MRKLLEKALLARLNENHEDANRYMREYMVATARQIHESLRNDEEPMIDGDDTSEYFTEEDLDDAENTDLDLGDAEENLADDSVDMDASSDDVVDASADEGTADAGSTDERLDSIEDELEQILKKFDEMMDKVGGADEESFEGFDDAEDMDADTADMDADAADMDADVDIEDEDENAFKKPMAESADDEDDFDDLAESLLSELEKVTAKNTDGLGDFGTVVDKPFKQNRKSPVPMKKTDPALKPGNPDVHKGFDREKSPSSGEFKADNNHKGVKKMTSVPAGGDKSATLNSTPVTKNKSVLGGK